MGHTATTIFAPNIDVVGDVAYVLGRHTGDVGHLCYDTDVVVNGVVVDAGGKIKKWPKYKPVVSSLNIMTEAELKSVNYGLRISKFTSASALISGVAGGNEWGYIRPQSGDKARILDFMNPGSPTYTGYNSDARSFVESITVPSSYTQGSGGGTYIRMWMTPQNQLPASTIHWSDLTDVNGDSINLGNCYFGALFVNGGSYMYLTASNTLSADSYKAELFVPSSILDALSTGNWSVYLCLAYTACPTPVTVIGTINSNMLTGVYALPDDTVHTMNVQAAAAAANASIKDDLVTITPGAGRFTVAFGIGYKATPNPITIHATYKIYGGATSGAKTTLYVSQVIDLSATATSQTYNVSEIIRQGFPYFITVELTYTVGSSPTVYTAPDVSVPFPID